MDNFDPDEPIRPRSPCVTLGPLYFDIRTPVFVMHTYIVCISNSNTLNEVRISNFKYVYRAMRSKKSSIVHKSSK
jgi:hypothetical protein